MSLKNYNPSLLLTNHYFRVIMSKATKVFKKLPKRHENGAGLKSQELETKLKIVSSNDFKSTIENYSEILNNLTGLNTKQMPEHLKQQP